MTTIAYRDGVLAADTGMSAGDSTHGTTVKIVVGPSGALAGAAGRSTYAAAFRKWVEGGEIGEAPAAESDGNSCDRGLIIRPDGQIEIYEKGGMFPVTAPYYALGSGRPEALGAMFAGADARMAVQAAMSLDAYTFGEITVLSSKQER